MKIAILSNDNSKVIQRGGKHIHQNLLERGLVELGHDVHVFYPPVTTSKRISIIKKIISNPLLLSNPLVGRSIYFWLRRQFKRRIEFFSSLNLSEFDIIHCHDVISLYPIKHPNTILTLHGYLARETINYLPSGISDKNKREIFNFHLEIEKKALPNAKHIIAVDSRIKEYVVQEFNYPLKRISVVYNAIDTTLFSPVTDKAKISFRKKLKLPTRSFIVFVPRRYVKKNGVDYAAKAFSKLRSSDYFFIFAGGGPLKQDIIKTLKKNTNVLILDAVPNHKVHEYYKAADVVLIPSVTSDGIEEATSLSMLEGMSCGKVTICTKIGGMKEVVKHMKNGILIEQKNVNAIINAINYSKENYNNLSTLRQKAREYVVKNHSYLKHAEKIVEIYNFVLSQFKGGSKK